MHRLSFVCRMCDKFITAEVEYDMQHCLTIIDLENDVERIVCQECEINYLIPRFCYHGPNVATDTRVYSTPSLVSLILPEFPNFLNRT